MDFGFGLRNVDFARRLFRLTALVHLLGGDYGGVEPMEFGFAGSFGTLAAVSELLEGEVGFAPVAFGTADGEIEGVVGSSAGKRNDVVDGALACRNGSAAVRTDELLAGTDSRFEGLIVRGRFGTFECHGTDGLFFGPSRKDGVDLLELLAGGLVQGLHFGDLLVDGLGRGLELAVVDVVGEMRGDEDEEGVDVRLESSGLGRLDGSGGGFRGVGCGSGHGKGVVVLVFAPTFRRTEAGSFENRYGDFGHG